ncbi:MAG: hypothetical protein ACM3WS_08125 [Bacillota bacterium]
MSVADRRRLIEAAQALAKTNSPSIIHYENMLLAIAKVYAADTGTECDCVIRVKKNAAKEPT